MRPDRYYINIIITSGNQRHYGPLSGSPEPNQMHDSIIDTLHSAAVTSSIRTIRIVFILGGVESLMSEQFGTMQNI